MLQDPFLALAKLSNDVTFPWLLRQSTSSSLFCCLFVALPLFACRLQT
jgi:hypothetical protein